MPVTNRPSASVDRERTQRSKTRSSRRASAAAARRILRIGKRIDNIYRHLFAFREAAMRTGDHRIENDVFYGQMRLVLELRRQIRQPLWRSVDENGFYALVEPDQYENANDDEQHAKRSLEALTERQ